MAGDSRAYRSAEESARDLTTSIRREGGKLAERWATLRDRTDRWSVELDTTTSVRRPFCPLFLLFLHTYRLGRRSSRFDEQVARGQKLADQNSNGVPPHSLEERLPPGTAGSERLSKRWARDGWTS